MPIFCRRDMHQQQQVLSPDDSPKNVQLCEEGHSRRYTLRNVGTTYRREW